MNQMTDSGHPGRRRVTLTLLSRQVVSSGGITTNFGVACR
jgi:hypothetical protein